MDGGARRRFGNFRARPADPAADRLSRPLLRRAGARRQSGREPHRIELQHSRPAGFRPRRGHPRRRSQQFPAQRPRQPESRLGRAGNAEIGVGRARTRLEPLRLRRNRRRRLLHHQIGLRLPCGWRARGRPAQGPLRDQRGRRRAERDGSRAPDRQGRCDRQHRLARLRRLRGRRRANGRPFLIRRAGRAG